MHARSNENHTTKLGRAAILAASVLTAGCAAGPSDFAVRGTAAGLLAPVDLELRIDGDTERLSVTQDGPFSFETRLDAGASYTVVLVDSNLPCTLRDQTGVIAGADTNIELTCPGASLESVVVSGIAPVVALDLRTTDYVVELPLSQQAVTVTATVFIDGDTLSIAGTPVASGTPGPEIALDLGDNPVDIVVENVHGWNAPTA